MLPPSRGTLVPHIQRTNFFCQISKSYFSNHPVLPALSQSGWVFNEESQVYQPIHCLDPPVPTIVLELSNAAANPQNAVASVHAVEINSHKHRCASAITGVAQVPLPGLHKCSKGKIQSRNGRWGLGLYADMNLQCEYNAWYEDFHN